MSEFLQVITTLPSEADVDRIARVLVEERLAACVQVAGPVRSTYRWQGKVDSSEEWLCLIKTNSAGFSRLADRIGSLHPYEVPEMIAVPIVEGSDAYLSWLRSSLDHDSGCGGATDRRRGGPDPGE